MPKIADEIKKQAGFSPEQKINPEELYIYQNLNKLFYAPPNYKEEAKMLKMQAEKTNTERIGLHASAILASEKEFCLREQVLSLVYRRCEERSVGVGLKRIFTEGDFIHEKWQRLFIRGGLAKAKNMDISFWRNDYFLSYTPDINSSFFPNGEEYMVEIKSMNTFQFKKINSHPSAKKQLMLYMALHKKEKGFILVEDKNSQEFKIFVVYYDKEFIKPYLERLKEIKLAFNKKDLPKRICKNYDTKRANNCPMWKACFNVGVVDKICLKK